MLIKKSKSNQQVAKSTMEIPFLLLFAFFFSITTNAQCAMCRAALESEGNKTKVEAVNNGIVFLMAIPYLIVIVLGFVIYKMYYKKGQSSKPKTLVP